MVILFESYGNFVSGEANYFALISKKSRGTIILTDRTFSFKSIKDQILFQINISEIDNFVIRKRRNLHTIELTIDKVNKYNFYPHKRGNSSLKSSKTLTEYLFQQLTRAAYKNDYPVLYETKAAFWKGVPSEVDWKAKLHEGFLILTENGLSFKFFNKNSVYHEKVTQIKDIHRELIDSVAYIQIVNIQKKITSYLALKSNSRLIKQDELKTDKLYELINQAKNYKETEQLQIEEKKRELIKQIKTMLAVSSKIKLDTMRLALDMDEKEFFEKIFRWAKKFNFIVDGDEVVVDHDSIPQFMDNLATGFKISNHGFVKVKCSNCGKLVEFSAKICPYCGRKM